MNIYKVRFLDTLGKEVAEFGFYESKFDAEKRRAEVANLIKMKGVLDIRTIEVIPDSEKAEKVKNKQDENSSYYSLKENS